MSKEMSNIQLTLRGIKEINQITPHYFTFEVIKNVLFALRPFIHIYFFSRIVRGISQGSSFDELIVLAFISISLHLFVDIIAKRCSYKTSMNYYQFEARSTMHLSKKTMALAYSAIENPNTMRHRQSIDEYRNVNGGGLSILQWSLPGLIKHTTTIITSAGLTLSLFLVPSVHVDGALLGFIVSPLASILLVVLIILSIIYNMYAEVTFLKKLNENMSDFIDSNRVGGFIFDNYIKGYEVGKEIRIYNFSTLLLQELRKILQVGHARMRWASHNQAKYLSSSSAAALLIISLVHVFVALRAYAGMIGVGDIVLYVSTITQFVNGVSGWMMAFSDLGVNKMPLQNYFNYMDLPEAKNGGSQPLSKDAMQQFTFEIHNLSFRYPGAQQYTIRNLSLSLHSQQRIAIVGQNGSGKTTLIKLLCRLFDDYEGEILLNGIEIRQYDYVAYQAVLAVVFQDFALFAFSLAQNVAASATYDTQRVNLALSEAGFDERLANLVQGLETPLYKEFDEDGIQISGGEAQKIAIARAFYKDSPLVILDEPTSALDPIAESEIYARINSLITDRSVIFISHRLSSCKFSDDIIVLEHGSLAQRGTHDQLLQETSGIYCSMWQAQAQWYQ
jgi:ATP-binding cassette, subfamily B, bacterial